jgi:hypothetical protein
MANNFNECFHKKKAHWKTCLCINWAFLNPDARRLVIGEAGPNNHINQVSPYSNGKEMAVSLSLFARSSLLGVEKV